MAAQPAPLVAPNAQALATTELGIRPVAELVAETVRGLHKVDGTLVRVQASVGDDGYIDVAVTRVNFFGEDATVRVLLYPTAAPALPQPVPEPRIGATQPSELR